MASGLVNNKYRITRRIGGGSFGEIYMGVGPNGEKVAVKFERHGTRCPQLRHEYKVYRELTGCHGFCQVYYFGSQDNYNVMVMDLLGLSLEDLFNKCQRRFSLKTVLQIADQMLERVDTIHSRHLIHRDIKPANFVIGVGEQASNIFCVDFGLSKRYRHPKNLQHIPHRDGRNLTGTPRYASINNHLGIEQSRRDDLESIGYVLIYFLKGSLPWQGLKAKNAQKKYRLILEKKQQVSIAQLCQGCPSQFAEFLAYTRSLKFDAKPDIPYLRKLFRDLYHAQNCASIPKLWDWDGMDNDFNSVSNSTSQGATPAIIPAANNIPGGNLRPTTAAAIAMDNEMLMGNIANEDLDEDYGMDNGVGNANVRPNTAGAMMYNRASAAPVGAQPNAGWGYSRTGEAAPGMMKGGAGPMLVPGGGEYVDTLNSNRRPHTAHGARAGFPGPAPTAGISAGAYGVVDPSKQGLMYGEQDEEGDPVVAGARGMMRYRRNRTGADALPGQGAPGVAGASVPINGGANVPSYGASKPVGYGQEQYAPAGQGAASWAVYQGAAKPVSALAPGAQTAAHLQAQQQAQAMRKGVVPTSGAPVAGSSGWSPFTTSDRPKSATGVISGSHMAAGGLMATPGQAPTAVGPRPASGSTMGQSNGGAAAAGGAPWPTSNTNIAGSGGGNSLSYGSLKNRFLSGSGGGSANVASSGAAAGVAAVGGSKGVAGSSTPLTNTGSAKSKLFSLAR